MSAIPLPSSLALDGGRVDLDPRTGAPVRFVDDTAPRRRFLLDDAVPWHSAEHAWGAGHLVTSHGAGRWGEPAAVTADVESVVATMPVVGGVELTVERRGGALLEERHVFRNVTDETVVVRGLGITTPFADLYEDAETSLGTAVHAHVFTGGTWAWVMAQPMSGEGRVLGLIVREGGLSAYSIESRNANVSSNARGHVVLQATDRARAPHAFGGQPEIVLSPGAEHVLAWEVGLYADVDAFLSATRPPAELDAVAVEAGTPIRVRTPYEVSSPSPEVMIVPDETGAVITSATPGAFTLVIGGTARTEIRVHAPLRELVVARARRILDDHRARWRSGILAHALVPVDTRTGLAVGDGGWPDWSDGSERTGMAILLQLARAKGWIGPEADAALDGWAAFAREHLMDADGTPRRGSAFAGLTRLYDSPWYARFFLERHRRSGDPADLETAATLLERVFGLGAEGFLAIGLSEAVVDTADALDAAGTGGRARRLRERLVASGRLFAASGRRLPAHEVNYEQSMVAPLVCLLSDAYRLSGDRDVLEALERTIPWLLAFGGPQPHARLNGVAIRHWDGYWFGARRQWGDVFPHHWSALTSVALARLPREARTERTDAVARAVLHANTANVSADGSATCAFVFPSAVDGEPAHVADPLANDQDWHLALWTMLGDEWA